MNLKKLLFLSVLLIASLVLFFFISPIGKDIFKLNKTELITSENSFSLKSIDGSAVGIREFQINTKGINKIKVEFYVRSTEVITSEIPLLVDVYKENFDYPKYDRLIPADKIMSKPNKVELLFELSKTTPEEIKVRAYTLSKVELYLSDFKIIKGEIQNDKELLNDLIDLFLIYLIFVLFYLNSKKQFSLKYNLIYTFFVFLIYTISKCNYPFYHDSLGYWSYGKFFEKNGTFSLLNYDNALRGYLLPLLNYFIYKMGQSFHLSEENSFRIASSFFYSYLILKLIPQFVEAVSAKKMSIPKRIIFLVLFFVFWRGYMLYPLTDFIAFASIICAANLALKTYMSKKVSLFSCFCMGVFLYACINLRPSYIAVLIPFIFSIIFIVVKIYFYEKVSSSKFKAIFLPIFIFFLGALLIAFPQVLINRSHFETSSPFVPMEKFFNGQNLMLSKLYNGLTIQKYETYVGAEYDSSVALLNDPVGKEVVSNKKLIEFKSYGEYIDVVLSYPLKFFQMYLKHFFNGMDIRYSSPYILKFHSNVESTIIQLINYSVVFFAFLVAFFNAKRLFNTNNMISIIIIFISILPSFISLPTEPEVRFYMPITVILAIFTAVESNAIISYFSNKKIKMIFAIYLFIMFYISYNLNLNLYFL